MVGRKGRGEIQIRVFPLLAQSDARGLLPPLDPPLQHNTWQPTGLSGFLTVNDVQFLSKYPHLNYKSKI